MSIVLRSASDGRFLAGDSKPRWTPNVKEAKNFRRTEEALKTARDMNLPREEIELIFKSRRGSDMVIRLHEQGSRVLQ